MLGPLTIDGSGPLLLYLTDNGSLTEVPVPTGRTRGPASPRKSGSRTTPTRQSAGARRRKKPDDDRPETSPEPTDSKARRKTKQQPNAAEHPSDANEKTGRFAPVSLGPCPLCGSDVVEQPKSYGCSGWKNGCKFAIWKTIAGKAIGVRTAQALLKRGKSPLIKGFQSKAGKPFEAHLKLEGGEVRFEFGTGERRKPPKRSDAE